MSRLFTATVSVLIVLLMISAQNGYAVPPGVGHLVWSDEFDGNSLDTSTWEQRYPGPRRDGINTTQAVSVGNGAVTITTYTEDGTHYTGMIGTEGPARYFTHGYFEARILFNDHHVGGMWSAFWLQSPTYGNPIGAPGTAGTEIDVIEHHAWLVNESLYTHDNMGIHWDGYGEHHKSNYESLINLSGLDHETWHTYGLMWTPEAYIFYFHDQPVVTITTAVSQRSQYLVFSSEVMNPPASGFGSFEESTTFMAVDYIRVYAVPEPSTILMLSVAVPVLCCRGRLFHVTRV